jgi:hypothetical protein
MLAVGDALFCHQRVWQRKLLGQFPNRVLQEQQEPLTGTFREAGARGLDLWHWLR